MVEKILIKILFLIILDADIDNIGLDFRTVGSVDLPVGIRLKMMGFPLFQDPQTLIKIHPEWMGQTGGELTRGLGKQA